jgi:hypothetical protein
MLDVYWTAVTILSLGSYLSTGEVFAQCQLTADDWRLVQDALASDNFFSQIFDTGSCYPNGGISNDGLWKVNLACNKTLDEILRSQSLDDNCVATIGGLYYRAKGFVTEDRVKTEAIEICTGRPLNDLIPNYLCRPTKEPQCPPAGPMETLAPLITCIFGTLNLTNQERRTYFTTDADKTCMASTNFCHAFSKYQQCQPSFDQLLHSFFDYNRSLVDTYDCMALLTKGVADQSLQRCAQSFQRMYYYYCPSARPSLYDQRSLVAGLSCMAVFLLLLACCCVIRRAGTRRLAEKKANGRLGGIHYASGWRSGKMGPVVVMQPGGLESDNRHM